MRKPSPLNSLFISQFLSAFVDNMILFIALAIIHRDAYPDYYLPFVQSAFLGSYIFLSPWVGRFADRKPKVEVLIIGNLVKAAGVLMFFLNLNPALSYAIVGVGAVIYSPAKYGILPFLTHNDNELLKANSGLESYTILAILSGSIAGGFLSDFSITGALIACLALYAASATISTLILKDPGNLSIGYQNAIREFFADTSQLFKHPQSHYSLIGTGSFWMSSAVLRMIIFAWVPLVLGITSGSQISMIIAVTGIGIAAGALVTPWLVSIKTYRRTVWYGFAMGACIFAFLLIHSLIPTVFFLLLIGMMGGIYIVPMNACLQQVGHNTIGAGKTIAVQNFVENIFMFVGVAIYTFATKEAVAISTSLATAGFALLLMVSYLLLQSRRHTAVK